MSINADLNIAPYFDDYNIIKKYYRVLFKPGFAVQARELTQLQTTLQNQIQQFGENIYKEGSIIKGCTFTEIRNLKYVKVVDNVNPESFLERTEVVTDGVDEYYYELEDADGLKALILQGSIGFQSRAPDLNTFFVVYLNSVPTGATEKKQYGLNDSLSIKEYVLQTRTVNSVTTEVVVPRGTVATTSVANFADPIGDSFGLNVSEGIIFQNGYFLYVDDQTVVVKKYMLSETLNGEFIVQPDNISIGYVVDETIINSQQDTTLLDNSNGSPNENAPGADRLRLVPSLVARDTPAAETDAKFFILRRYENGSAVETRDVSQFNSIAKESARRTYETNGDYAKNLFTFDVIKNPVNDAFYVEMGEGVSYSKGYRISNDTKRMFEVPAVQKTNSITNQPVNFNYGGFCKVVNATGRVSIGSLNNVDLLNAADVKIGTAVVKNYTSDRLYLFGIRMTTPAQLFSNVKFVKQGTTNGQIEIIPKIINSTESSLIFNLNKSFVKSLSDVTFSRRRIKTNIAVNPDGTFVIAPELTEVFSIQNADKDLLVIGNNSNLKGIITATQINNDGNLAVTLSNITSQIVTVYYNVNIRSEVNNVPVVQPRLKQLFEVFVKTTYVNTKKIYTLGLPDVISIVSVTDPAGNDVTASFKLQRNQKDDFYDHSYIEKIQGTASPKYIGEGGVELTIKVKVFKVDTSSVFNVFTIASYTNIPLSDIPRFESQSGLIYDLKSCIDFRPYRTPISAYSTNTAGATSLSVTDIILPDYTTEIFDSGVDYTIPAADTSGSVTIEHFTSRVDYIIGSSYGRFKYIKGSESVNSASKIDIKENSIIAEILVPGYPLLNPLEANRLNKRNETISVKQKITKTYTMKDIDNIAQNVERLSYYASLSALETSTANLLIQDDNGNNRFKNGIVVDPFNDLSIAEVTNPSFDASVDFTEKALYPSFTNFQVNMRAKTFTDTISYGPNGDIATLAFNTQEKVISQQYATGSRNCTSNFFLYNGTGYLRPEFDVGYDTVTTPVTIDIDLATPFAEYTDDLSKFVNLTSTARNVLSSNTKSSSKSTVATVGNDIIRTTDTTRTTRQLIETVVSKFAAGVGETTDKFVGDFVTNTEFTPYMRSREVSIEMYGLRPNTRHYFFFNGTPVDQYVANGVPLSNLQGGSTGSITTGQTVRRNGNFGSEVKANENGSLYAVFNIPGDTFLVGERELVVADVDVSSDIQSSSISYGKLKYNAYNFSVDKAGLTVSTRHPEFDISKSSTQNSVTTRSVSSIKDVIGRVPPVIIPPIKPVVVVPPIVVPPIIKPVQPPVVVPPSQPNVGFALISMLAGFGNPYNPKVDPLAQTFFVKDAMTRGADALYVGKLDLYFKRKSPTNGVTVMLREVINGYPSAEILPFSKIHLNSVDVKVSNDATVPTVIDFKAPVRLDAEKEYAIVVMPDAGDPDYLIFTQKVGGTDLSTGLPINSDWGDGVLFTSTNNAAWKSYQDEDVKFDLYRYNFNVNSGSVELESTDYEFFDVSSTIGIFVNNEYAYTFKGTAVYQIVLTANTNVITGTDLNSIYNVGDYLYVENNLGNKDIFKVERINSDTEMFVDKIPSFFGSLQSRPVVVGIVNYFNPRKPDTLILEQSSARDGRNFVQSDIVRGLQSGTQADISTIRNIDLSYIQAMVNRVTDADTNVRIAVKAIDPLNVNDAPSESEFSFANKKMFNEKGCRVYSKSNDLAGAKNLKLVLNLDKADNPTTTPVVDIETAQVFAYIYNVTDTPETTSKYISKKIELQEGFDSEDFRLYATGYRPPGTDIKAYIKVRNDSDPVTLRNNPWIELEKIQGENMYSNVSNTNDYKEYLFGVKDADKDAGIITYANETGTYVSYRSFAIRIDLISSNVAIVPKLLDYRGIAFE